MQAQIESSYTQRNMVRDLGSPGNTLVNWLELFFLKAPSISMGVHFH